MEKMLLPFSPPPMHQRSPAIFFPQYPSLLRHRLYDSSRTRFSLFRSRAAALTLAASSSPQTSTNQDSSRLTEQKLTEQFIEVGYISSVHGLKGELRVKPNTDFPELRFAKPGKRWVRSLISGKEVVSEVELAVGRPHPGQKSWIVSLDGIDTVEQAKQIVGSALLVKEEDRPDLDEGEFYTPDLVGMKVVIKETGKLVGHVFSVVNYGANDILQVTLDSTGGRYEETGPLESELSSSRPYVWIPFVKAIVPDIDMDNREMLITPPKGLLDLNQRVDMRLKKERRQLEWKQRKQLQRRLITAKKKLGEMGQKHVLEGLKSGEKTQKSLLANQIVDINLKLFQHAYQSINRPCERYTLPEATCSSNMVNVSQRDLHMHVSEEDNMNYGLQKEGELVCAKSKVAIIIMVNDLRSNEEQLEFNSVMAEQSESRVRRCKELLIDYIKSSKVEERDSVVPLIVVCPAQEIHLYEEFFSSNDYFDLKSQKVWLLEEEKLPNVNTGNMILLRNLWEIIQSPTGPGGIFSLLSSHGIVDDLNKMDIDYVQICSLDDKSVIGDPMLIGLVSSRSVDVGIKIFEEDRNNEDKFNIIISMKHLNKICQSTDKLMFSAVEEKTSYIGKVDDGGITSSSSKPNSYRFYSSIYNFLNVTSLDRICILQVLP